MLTIKFLISLLMSLIMMTCNHSQTQCYEAYDTIYTPQHSPILLLPREEKDYGYLINDSCNTKLYSISYKNGREALKDSLRMCYWREYEKEKTVLWQNRTRLFYIILFDENKGMKDIKFLNYGRRKYKETGDTIEAEQYYIQYEAIIKKALWDTDGDWDSEKHHSSQGYFYFDVF